MNFAAGMQVGGQDAAFGGMRNRIINGDMRIDQRNVGASVNNVAAAGTYALDRWRYYGTSASKFSVQQNAGAVTPPIGFTNYLGITSSSANSPAATDEYAIQQYIEGYNIADLGWGTASAATVTLSFWVRSSLTGTFSGVVKNSDSNRTYPFSYTINQANTWEKETITIPGDTTGTWLTTNGRGIALFFHLGTGSTYLTTANVWTSSFSNGVTGSVNILGTNGATFYITGVQLEKGSAATAFEYRQYSTELALCQRYFCKTFPQATAPAQNAGTAGCIVQQDSGSAGFGTQIQWRFPVTMRATPSTFTTFNPSAANANPRNTADNTDGSVIGSNVAASDSAYAIVSGNSAGVGRCIAVHMTANAEL
jgi:hypothetical protein